MSAPRVLVVEDDETLQQFFGMVLETLSVRGQLCGSAEEALEALAAEPADVIITDLLLPGLDGRGLLDRLRADAALAGHARIVVTSGSIDEAVRRELQARGAWRVLGKPVSVKALRSCIEDAVAEISAHSALTAAEQAIVQSHFAGDTQLFKAYRHGSLSQIPVDLQRGDDALARGDVQALRRVAHNLKSVLTMLSHGDIAQVAASLEVAAEQALQNGAAPATLEAGWVALRGPLSQLTRPS